jgi:hypothetical protein
MKVSGICLVILICTVVLISGVYAQDVDKGPGYTVTPAVNLPLVIVPMTGGSIAQGQENWYSYFIPPGTASITTDLNWVDTSDSLSLTIVTPDRTLGPYYDASDGIVNGRIALVISRAGGLAPGTWNFRVYGDQVTGIQSYNFYVY